MLVGRARRAVRTGHRRELPARCDEDAAAAGDAARRHEPSLQQLRWAAVGEIAELEGDGNYDCTWVPAKSENCQTCAASRRPRRRRSGRTSSVMPSMQVIVPKRSHPRPAEAGARGSQRLDGAAKGATVDFQTTTATWDHQVDFETAEPDAARRGRHRRRDLRLRQRRHPAACHRSSRQRAGVRHGRSAKVAARLHRRERRQQKGTIFGRW